MDDAKDDVAVLKLDDVKDDVGVLKLDDVTMEWLLCRFVTNLPPLELSNWNRLLYHIEKMWWFYLDCYAKLPASQVHHYAHHAPSFRKFSLLAVSTLLKATEDSIVSWLDPIIIDYGQYKRSIPVAGCILVNKDSKEVLMIKPFKCERWAFPKGKQNKDESILETAIRETAEETGHQPTVEDMKVAQLIRPYKHTYFFLLNWNQDQISKAQIRAAKSTKLSRFEVEQIRWIPISSLGHLDLTSLAKNTCPLVFPNFAPKSS